ncbi:MAG: tyrosine-type recombinase/integrase [Cyclobacteriaceae bacterium]|nr:tyrosine-type recombinase/integrase [Cyclobacteriaceae bacterium]
MSVYDRAKVNLKIINKPNQNGEFPIAVRVYLPGFSNRDYRTGVFVKKEDWDNKGERIINKTEPKIIIEKERALKVLSRLDANEHPFSWQSFELQFKDYKRSVNIIGYIEQKALDCEKPSTARTYTDLVVKLIQFQRDAKWTHVTRNFVDSFMKYILKNASYRGSLENRIQTSGGAKNHLRTFKLLYNRAELEGLTDATQRPFKGIKLATKPKETNRFLFPEEIMQFETKKYIPTQPKTTQWELARDLFLFSYWAYGLNAKDFFPLPLSVVRDDVNHIFIRRSKTGNSLEIPITEAMRRVINKYKGSNDYYLFPIHTKEALIYKELMQKEHNNALSMVRKNINRMAKQFNIENPEEVNIYTARHSYAYHYITTSAQPSLYTLGEHLGHSSESSTVFYVKSLRGYNKKRIQFLERIGLKDSSKTYDQ